jgi:hypothetical protein
MERKAVLFSKLDKQQISQGSLTHRRAAVVSPDAKYMKQLLSPPGQKGNTKTDYEVVLSHYNKLPESQSLLLAAFVGCLAILSSQIAWQWRCVLFPLLHFAE